MVGFVRVDCDRTVCRWDGFLLSFLYLQFGPVGFVEWTLLHFLYGGLSSEGSAHVQMCWCLWLVEVATVMGTR